MVNTDTNIPEVRQYMDYRKFLKDFYTVKKEKSKDYSYRVFTRKAGVGSPSHLKMVMDGQRNLTNQTLYKYVNAIGFKKKIDAKFFELLVNYNQEQDADRKIELFHEIIQEKDKKGLSFLEKEQFNFLSQWHYVAIYVLVDLQEFNPDPEWITSKLRKKITKSNVEKAINDLIKIGLLEYDSERGLRQAMGALDTSDEIINMAVVPYHRNMINLALNYLEEGDWSLREFNGGTLPMNPKTLEILKTKIREFRREVNEMTDNLEDVSDVYQFNLQLFPLTENNV
ncbi:MAG: TIGR02147 family protein [Deltaproteobacteria bacterium]|nr:MAG: TIGR02147 family protein [Deltaproteobacteria bacterium]